MRLLHSGLLLAAALPLLAAEPLAVKPGLWETTTEIVTSGIPALPALPPGTLDNLPPEQRAKAEAAMKMLGSGGQPQTTVARSCVTAKDIEEGVFKAARDSQNQQCQFDVVSATPKRQEMKMTCPSQAGAEGRMVLNVIDSSNIQATMDAKIQAVTMNMKMKGRWLAAACSAADER